MGQHERQGERKADRDSQHEENQLDRRRFFKLKIWPFAAVVISFIGTILMNFFGTNPRIFYLIPFAIFALAFYCVHQWVRFLEKSPTTAIESEGASKRARVFYVENKLILPEKEGEPLRVAFGVMNRGDADATLTLKDHTFFYTVDPTQTVFKYQPHAPVEMPIPAIPNAKWDAELRFDFKLTPEKLDALRTGKARLFFYARGEYRDESGVYPLPFAEMYDAMFPRHLIAPPPNIVFE
jgi:hypothetical protein